MSVDPGIDGSREATDHQRSSRVVTAADQNASEMGPSNKATTMDPNMRYNPMLKGRKVGSTKSGAEEGTDEAMVCLGGSMGGGGKEGPGGKRKRREKKEKKEKGGKKKKKRKGRPVAIDPEPPLQRKLLWREAGMMSAAEGTSKRTVSIGD
eukprot:CAMPEP_0175063608 /NCGR_PEP_ID=MMETSP0052_2-20121109/14855_1 /TAXON_ID=51329 ORGANISM="Polytomella parva, Strain SAG 63-3" /NCGR_SAMPLE_ID=MMETSP0052_2 /ASSEMBLY_ACC=CAM_ASM_000194 /LENGTH=150 /DNA_ID=CAMNT_0016329833 /DNA_START=45 /DNA_END=498 /DNA_ORIENTATION=+